VWLTQFCRICDHAGNPKNQGNMDNESCLLYEWHVFARSFILDRTGLAYNHFLGEAYLDTHVWVDERSAILFFRKF